MTDWEEVGVEHWIEKGLITYDVSGNIMLPTIMQCMKFTECSYVEEGLERFQSEYAENFGAAIVGARGLPILSDPTRKDSDKDGYKNTSAPQPLRYNQFQVYNGLNEFDNILEGDMRSEVEVYYKQKIDI